GPALAVTEPEPPEEVSEPAVAAEKPESPPSESTHIADLVHEAIHLYQSKRFEDAIILLNKTLRHDAGLMTIRQLLGNAYYRNGMFQEAIATYEEALALGAADVELHENLGVLYAKIGDYPRAKEQWQAVLRRHPERDDIAKRLNRLTKLLHRKPAQPLEKKEQTETEASAADDKHSPAPPETQVVSEFAESHDDEEKEHLLAVGVAHYRKKEYDAAIQTFKHAVELFPDLKEAYFFLGNAYFKKKKFQEAAEIYELLQQMEADNLEAHENLGLIYARTGLYDKALHQWRKLLESHPDREDLRVRFQKVSQLVG
ncbi:MAG: tetratricopeptide repeat protein, partial [Calditrichaeota bacterium]